MTKGSENPFPYITFVETADPATPPADTQYMWLDTDGIWKVINESATVTNVISAAGSVATDAIWDTAGDLAVGSGANTAARLVKGAAGANLSSYNGALAWNGGTSFPATPATGDRYWRSDLNTEFVYNGTIWLSSAIHQVSMPVAALSPITASGTLSRLAMPGAMGGTDIYLVDVVNTFFINGGTALSGSHKWVGTVNKQNTAGSASLGTITIDSGASSQWRQGTTLSINAAAAIASGYCAVEIAWVKTGTPGGLFSSANLTYRTITT